MAISDRFKDAPWFEKIKNKTVLIGGAGGIGSWLSFLLARVGAEIYINDFDLIEEHNIGGQLFSISQVGKYKVDAIKDNINDFSLATIITSRDKITSETYSNDVVFSAFDNMQARKDMFESWVKSNSNNPNAIFIDGRLSAEQIQIYCVTKDDIDRYRENLFDDSEVEDAPCTLKQTSHVAAMIASIMVSFYTNHITNIAVDSKDRVVPFYFEYFIPINLISTEE